MKRSMGALAVVSLIGAAVWVGLAFGRRDVVFLEPFLSVPVPAEELECPPGEMRGDTISDTFIDPRSYPSPKEALRNSLPGLLASDRVAIHGEVATVRREGYKVAVVAFGRNEADDWLVVHTESCVSAGIFDG